MTGPAADATFVVENASRRMGSLDALADLSLRVGRGERVAVIGPSGAGKTTLLRLLAAVLWPSRGRILSLGEDTKTLAGRRLRAFRRRIGFLYQSDNLIPGLRVAHNVLMGRLGHWSLPRAALSLVWPRDLGDARRALQEVELADKLWELPGTLSGGEQRRVAIARLLVQRSDAILADEPCTGLDPRLGQEVIGLLARLSDGGATLVVSLHDLNMLGEAFDRVVALRQGRLCWQGRPDQLTRTLLEEIYGAEYRALRLDELSL